MIIQDLFDLRAELFEHSPVADAHDLPGINRGEEVVQRSASSGVKVKLKQNECSRNKAASAHQAAFGDPNRVFGLKLAEISPPRLRQKHEN